LTLPEPSSSAERGKDSALALYTLLHRSISDRRSSHHVTEGTTTASACTASAVNFSGAGRLTRLPLHESASPAMLIHLRSPHGRSPPLFTTGVRTVAFGDIFLEDLVPTARKTSPASHDASFPLWKRDTRELISSFPAHFAPLPLASTQSFDPSFAGRDWTNLLSQSSPHADPCGETEFHTFVFDGRFFNLPFLEREIVNRMFCVLRSIRKWREQQNERQMSHKQKFALRICRFCPDSVPPLAIAPILEFHPRWRDTPLSAPFCVTRLAFSFPLLALFLGDIFIGFTN